jgi:hypothetical protein
MREGSLVWTTRAPDNSAKPKTQKNGALFPFFARDLKERARAGGSIPTPFTINWTNTFYTWKTGSSRTTPHTQLLPSEKG